LTDNLTRSETQLENHILERERFIHDLRETEEELVREKEHTNELREQLLAEDDEISPRGGGDHEENPPSHLSPTNSKGKLSNLSFKEEINNLRDEVERWEDRVSINFILRKDGI